MAPGRLSLAHFCTANKLQLDAVTNLRSKLAARHRVSTAVSRFSSPMFIVMLIIGWWHSSESDMRGHTHSNITLNVASYGYFGVSPKLFDLQGLKELQILMSGPVPVIPIENYLDVSAYARSSMNQTQAEKYGAEVAGWFGKALTLGTLHVAPDTPLTRRRRKHDDGSTPKQVGLFRGL